MWKPKWGRSEYLKLLEASFTPAEVIYKSNEEEYGLRDCGAQWGMGGTQTPREGIFIHSRTGTAGRRISGIKSILKIIVKMCFELLGSLNKMAKND